MRARSVFVGLVLGLLGAGCTLVENGACVLPSKVRESLEDCAERRRNRRWAEQAWKQAQTDDACAGPSADYADGFKDGFADFLYAGGDGEPPPLPPAKYRTLCYQTPRGYQAVENWFAGYRRGAAAARDGGYRQWVTGPSSLPTGEPPPPPPPPPPAPAEQRLPPPRPAPPAPAEQWLPQPQPAPPAEEKRSVAPVRPPAAPPVPVEYRQPAQTAPPAPPKKILRIAPVEVKSLPAAPVDVRARFRPERNQWEVVWNDPEGGARTTAMSPGPFAEMIERARRESRDGRPGAARHGVAIDDGVHATTGEMDDQAYEGLAAFLRWYYEDLRK